MRRVLLTFEPPDGGVAENVGQLALNLGRYGWEVEVAGPPHATIYPRLAHARVPLHQLPFARGYGNIGREVAVFRGLSRLLRTGSYDLLHCHSAKAGVLGRLAARRARVPAIYSPHALPFVGPFSLRRRVGARAVERALAPLSARIVCVSEDERREAAAAGLGGGGRLRVVHNGCMTCDRSVAPDRVLQALRADGPVAGAVSVLRPQKRLDLLIDAAPEVLRRVPNAHVVVVGNGPLAEPLRRRAERVGVAAHPRFKILPFVPPSARYLQALDVFALPSDWEGLPIAVLEALACGVPQVASDVGGTPEAVTEDTGILVRRGDAGALSDAIVALLQDEDRRRRMSKASVARHGSRFTLSRMVAMTATLYEEAVRATPDGTRPPVHVRELHP